MFEVIIAPIAFALIMLGLGVYAVTRAIRRRARGGDAASEASATDTDRERQRERRAG
ncbi:MAG TPA: hypothetical protein VEA38_17115 [Terriglobales bacterium]|nr:hypothetical protein [Terriglobales bacterium]